MAVFRLGIVVTVAWLLVQCGAYDGGHKLGEVRCAFVELKPADHTVIGEIFCHARFRDAEMFGELRLERISATPACPATQKISHGDAQSLASFDVIIAGEIGIGEDKNAGADGSVIRVTKFYRRTSQQAAKLHFEQRQSRG